MLYIEDTDGAEWLRVVELLGEQAPYDLVLCLYHGSTDTFLSPFVSSPSQEHLERVTTYGDESEPPCSARLRVTSAVVDALAPHLGEFEDWGDTLILYPPRERTWAAAFIPHERVVLIRDEHVRDYLEAAGLTVSHDAPEGW